MDKYISAQAELCNMLRLTQDLCGVLTTGTEWLLRYLGPANIAIYLPNENGDALIPGSYVSLAVKNDDVLLDKLVTYILREIGRKSSGKLSFKGEGDEMSEMIFERLAGYDLIVRRCTHLTQTIGMAVVFRQPQLKKLFTPHYEKMLKVFEPIFSTALMECFRSNDEPDDDQGSQKGDKADWWKRGEQPPF
jgi:hypothetical protein